MSRSAAAGSLRPGLVIAILALLLLLAALVSLGLGRYEIPPLRVVQILFSGILPADAGLSEIERNVVLNVRLPRILTAIFAGAGLALCGAALQGVFRNPLVGPHIIGVSSGAAFGGTLAILLSASQSLLLLLAFAFGVLSLLMVYALHALVGRRNMLALVLAGVIIGGFFGALVSLAQYLADTEEKLPRIVFWLLGSFATADYEKLRLMLGPLLIGGVLLILLRWRINILSLGDDDAQALGISVAGTRWLILVLIGLVVSAQVAVSGVIGWVGLVVPHIARMLVGPDHRPLLPASLIAGALYMVLIDDLARTMTDSEIPLGILTALLGAPIFVLIFFRSQRGGRDG
ncbi:iron ABC transporter permease [Bosea sp. BK604]|uniref:FecCD family ABC transporter permease n=1 Tax=Bosea sp. BK604 TaxID=2512180 RepID=UPI00104AD9E7|nr:iron ABC transporter permease [Bosea sp. BK604]TCR66571.1 iron complex transport system permease protein [Bosea sp. BK604]